MAQDKQRIALYFYFLIAIFISACSVSHDDSSDNQITIPIEKLAYSPEIISAVNFIENNVTLPSRVEPLKSYSRYYAKQPQGSDYDIMAVFISNSYTSRLNNDYVGIPDLQNAYFSQHDKLPIILDGGCSVVTVYFNSQTMKFRKIGDPFSSSLDRTLYDGICNGLA